MLDCLAQELYTTNFTSNPRYFSILFFFSGHFSEIANAADVIVYLHFPVSSMFHSLALQCQEVSIHKSLTI